MTNLSAQSDDELIECFVAGQGEAFEALVLRYKNSLYQYIKSLVKDDGAAGDLFQEVFLALYTHAGTFKAQGKVKSWLFLTARNKTLNYFRGHKNNVSLDEPDEEGNSFWHETLSDGQAGQLEQLATQEGAELIRNAVGKLSPRQQEIVYLRQYFSFQEIADMVGRPLGTVLADCHRAIQKVRQLLASEG